MDKKKQLSRDRPLLDQMEEYEKYIIDMAKTSTDYMSFRKCFEYYSHELILEYMLKELYEKHKKSES